MRKLLTTFLLALAAAGIMSACTSTQWVHPTKSPDEFQRDVYDCQQVAYQYAANLGQRFAGNPFIVADEQITCIQRKHGWYPVRQQRQVAPSTCPDNYVWNGNGCSEIARAVVTEFSCPAGASKAGAGCVSDSITAEPLATPTWCLDRGAAWRWNGRACIIK
jgi:hypothetical protein